MAPELPLAGRAMADLNRQIDHLRAALAAATARAERAEAERDLAVASGDGSVDSLYITAVYEEGLEKLSAAIAAQARERIECAEAEAARLRTKLDAISSTLTQPDLKTHEVLEIVAALTDAALTPPPPAPETRS